MSGVIICKDANALAARAADLIIHSARSAISQRQQFTLVLTGGSTPEKTYRVLAHPEHAMAVDWSRACLFFGDERFVPPDDDRSNLGMVERTLLSHPAVQAARVYPIRTRKKSVEECAAEYAAELSRFFATGAGSAPPRFDLILLGLGEDGHVASLFPHSKALLAEHDLVTWSPPGTLPPLVNRITLTFPVLNAARHIVFLATGERKASAVRNALREEAGPRQLSGSGRPTCGRHGHMVPG